MIFEFFSKKYIEMMYNLIFFTIWAAGMEIGPLIAQQERVTVPKYEVDNLFITLQCPGIL